MNQTTFKDVCLTDGTVNAMLKQNASLEEVVVQLVMQRNSLNDQLVRLQMIAPQKLTTPDGRQFIYRCPDALIPNQQLS